MKIQVLVAIDPGREKCGMVMINTSGEVLMRIVLPTEQVLSITTDWTQQHATDYIILGDGTHSLPLRTQLREHLPAIPVRMVDETHSTEQGRKLYWRYHPPRGWRRLLPVSLQTPPEPVDAYAAEILAKRFLTIYRP